jgi:L-ribulose-5-phosphate 3-epimerase
MRSISIYSWFGFCIPMEERFRMIKAAGFNSTFFWWGDEFMEVDGPKEQHAEMARRQGLQVENVHLPFEHANNLWLDNLEADALMNSYMRSVKECAGQNIPVAVLHLTEGEDLPCMNQLGFDRMKRLVDQAERYSVNIALENLRKPDHLKFILSGIHSDRLGFCFDSGHQHCRTKDVDFLSLYGSRLMALHLHDNDESQDQHRIPGEGTIDWKLLCRKLKATRYTGAAALEVTNEFSEYKGRESVEEFLKRAYEAARSIDQKL